ncbi:lactate utilization protein C [Halalkalibacterium halodurans]|uniref:Lactate utilization protein C n=1 Tax=Halalkalibacterium halodurans (strain ATCC BAA-125 / DSM 18197 / FERM 7344 / JCM 9153 / C-125) TaxID=272558 RepID=LUTC_HALH5|nr:lactate utilization protein C [Halalkalibacterium halodurans]Q9KBU0.1 RecName: Full=Lactate utilization protein C [Halalkalibacterium halodurans C-125]MED4171813.1 lactate utilization protein C [Halalkalibacterium halodurans]BAB05553.1 BH1834 [Halalkalibacterium halodurans C-125]
MIQRRETFLNNVAEKLGRGRRTAGVKRPDYTVKPQFEVMKEHSSDQLVNVLSEQCTKIHTDVKQTKVDRLEQAIDNVLEEYSARNVITWNDPRFDQFGLTSFLQREQVEVWDHTEGERLVEKAEQADIGITFADYTLAESGTVVLLSGNGKGRSVSLLPTYYIAIIPKSTLVPRMSQVTRELHLKAASGERLPSCINFISGPSNSADIEMNLVVGVHGPIRACYIVVEDR